MATWNMKTFRKGASILTISAILVKLLSAVYRVPYQNMVGDEGFYIYQQVYPFIGIFLIWTSYGFSVAVSKLVAGQQPAVVSGILRIAFGYLAILSLIVFCLLWFGSDSLADWMGDPKLASLLRVSAFVVIWLPFLAVFKGAFQATGDMRPVAVSNVIEQAVRVTIVLVGTWWVLRLEKDLYQAGEMAMWGAVIGGCAGVLLLAMIYRQKLNQGTTPARVKRIPLIKTLTSMSISLSASSLLLLVFQLVDSFTVFKALQTYGYSSDEAMQAKGVYDRGQPLVQMGILLATTLALAVVPLIAYQIERKGRKGAEPFIRLTYRTALLFGSASAMGLIALLPYINQMLFETRSGSAALMVFCLQILWLSLLLPMVAILQGTGKVIVPTSLLLVALLLKLGTNGYLVEQYGIMGASLASVGSLGIVLVAMTWYFKRVWSITIVSNRFLVWLLLALVSLVVVVSLWSFTLDHWLLVQLPARLRSTIISATAVPLGGLLFLWLIMKVRLLDEREWFILPFGRQLAALQLRIQFKG